MEENGDIEYPERLTKPIEPSQWSTQAGLTMLELTREVQMRLIAEGVARERYERIVQLEAELEAERKRPCACEMAALILGGEDG